jgi:hypothetical protein
VNGVTAFLIFVILPIALYVLSLKLNPWVKCSRCKNQPRRKGWVGTYAHHICPKCRGTGQQLRFGRNFIFGEPVPPDKR